MNGHETEVKFYVSDIKKLELRLLELKAQLIQARAHEINFRFDTAQNELRKDDKVLRLRQDTKARFTFKGPSRGRESGVFTRQEIEFVVEDFENAKQFLQALGFKPVIFYEKFRTTYEILNTHVMLDELPHGSFIEIEGEDIQILQEIANLLKLNWDAKTQAGYHALFERAAKKYNLDPSNLSFKALELIQISAEDLKVHPAD